MLKAIESRRSVRKYLDKPVDDGLVRSIMESARSAPSGNNSQPWHFIAIRDEGAKKLVAKASHDQSWMLSAPVFIACVADMRSRTDEPGATVHERSPDEDLKKIIRDTAIATEHAVLEAEERGLGTCWVSWFEQGPIRTALGLPGDVYVVTVLTLGYPAEHPAARPRKPLDEILHFGKWER